METIAILAADAQTWKKDQWGYSNSGVFTLCATDATVVQYVALEDQDTATSTSTVNVGRITADHVFEMYELDGAVDSANVGESYGIDVTSNIITLDEAEVTNKVVKCIDVASNYEPSRNTVTDVKGRCRVRVLTAAIDG
jgi:hypothetical protein